MEPIMAVAKSTMSRRSNAVKFLEERHVGYETVDWSTVEPDQYESSLSETIRHYGYFYDKKQYVLWTTEWIKQHRPEDLKYYKAAEDWRTSSTLASLCKVELNGCELSDSTKLFQESAIERIIAYGKTVEPLIVDTTVAAKRKSPSELLGEKTSEFIGEIEGCIDDFIHGVLPKDWSIYNIMVKEERAAQTAHDTIRCYHVLLEELRETIEDKTEDLVEAYSHMSTKQQKSLFDFIAAIITDCEKFLVTKKATRKPRAKKATPASKQVSKVIFLSSSPEYKIASVSPEKIVGAEAVYLFNTKTRVMKYLSSYRVEGFLVKGTTIIGFDEKASFKKMLRKPDDVIAMLCKATKAKAIKQLKALKTVESETDGRINKDTIILKVI
jgi:hypothetical protein